MFGIVPGVPPGTVLAFAGNTAPRGYLLCDGAAVSRSKYKALFNAIGTAHGSGDGATTFHLPDYRGLFLRGVDGGAGQDPDRAGRTAMKAGGATGDNVGSVQSDQFRSHTHTFNYLGRGVMSGSGGSMNDSGSQSDLKGTNAAGGNETRPKNANVNYIIKI